MISLKPLFSVSLIFIITNELSLLSAEDRLIRPVLSVGDNDIVLDSNSFSYIPFQTTDEPRYLIVAPSQVRPGQVYRVVVDLLGSPFPLTITASVQCNNEEVVGTTENIIPGESQNLLMKIPFTARGGDYQLKVEGNANGIRGGNGFIRNTTLTFFPEFLTILIQTNQLVYNMKQPISIRVILLNTEMKPYVDAVDVYLLDSQGIIMKRWNSVYSFQGFVSLEFVLPEDYPKGWWTVRVQALQQIEEKRILMERWFTNRFDVSVSLPAFISQSQTYIEGTIYANHTNLMPVEGNVTIRVIMIPDKRVINWRVLNGDYDNYTYFGQELDIFEDILKIEEIKRFKGKHHFRYDLSQLFSTPFITPFINKEILVHVTVGERFFDHLVTGYARTKLINSTLTLRFLDTGTAVFKPGLPFETYVAVSYSDFVGLSSDLLTGASLFITPSFALNRDTIFGSMEPLISETVGNSLRLDLNENGVAKLRLKIPPNLERFTLKARFESLGQTALAELSAISFYTASNRVLYITSSTESGVSGEYGIFHVYSNFYLKTFHYLVVSKGNILITGQELTTGMLKTITTFSVSLSPEMAPNCNVIVYHITPDGEIIADSISLPVEGINRAKLKMKVNLNQDRSGNRIEFMPQLSIASYIGFNAIDADFEEIQGFNDITKAKAEINLRKFERKHSKNVILRTLDGIEEKALYYLTHNSARDSPSTFAFNSLVVFTNLKVSMVSNRCNPNVYYNQTLQNQFRTHTPNDPNIFSDFLLLSCLSVNQCYETHQQCDGIQNCADNSDEVFCRRDEEKHKIFSDFFIYRKNRNNYFYQASGENYAWVDAFTSYKIDNYVVGGITVPQRPVNWRLNAIGVGQDTSFSVMDDFVYWYSVRPFFITVEAPEQSVLGEQIGIRVAAFNYQPYEIRVDIILENSSDYRFVHVGPMGRVSSYMPITTSGTHQHLIYIKPYSSILVPFPIVPTKRGNIKIVVIGRTQVAKDIKVIDMEVISEGGEVRLHTPIMLDMRAQAYLVKFLDINVTEDPIIPYQDQYRRYVYGSPKAQVCIIGDIVGTPSQLDRKIEYPNLDIGSPAKTGDLRLFNFAYRLYTLIYLRLTNQLENNDKQELTKNILQEMNRDFVNQMTFYRNDSFVMFDINDIVGSVWLTAYSARVYYDAQFDDWHNFIYIDPKIIQRSIDFIIRHQILDNDYLHGSFYEPGTRSTSPRFTPVALTAHVLITLVKVSALSEMGVKVSNSKQSAISFLERNLPSLLSPYEVAISTYALMISGSSEAKSGFNILESMRRDSQGMYYWSDTNIEPMQLQYQNQRPFIQPRNQQHHESIAVEGTSYALMIYSAFGGVIQDNIVKWINSMRLNDGVVVSTFDTIIAIQALTDYSFRSQIQAITDMTLEVEASSNPGIKTRVVLTQSNLSNALSIDVEPNVWGHVTLTAKGAGLAMVQLATQYNVDKDFQLGGDAFDINVDLRFSGRNKSRIYIKSCAKWLLTDVKKTSGIVAMELTLPTGYWQHKAVIDRYLQTRTVPRLTSAKVVARAATFMFDFLDNDWSCVNFHVDRWLPVANLTRWLKVKVFDLNEPGYFIEKVVDDFALYALHICEVCGSYQCPYCPYFSHSLITSSNHLLIIFAIILIIFSINIT